MAFDFRFLLRLLGKIMCDGSNCAPPLPQDQTAKLFLLGLGAQDAQANLGADPSRGWGCQICSFMPLGPQNFASCPATWLVLSMVSVALNNVTHVHRLSGRWWQNAVALCCIDEILCLRFRPHRFSETHDITWLSLWTSLGFHGLSMPWGPSGITRWMINQKRNRTHWKSLKSRDVRSAMLGCNNWSEPTSLWR